MPNSYIAAAKPGCYALLFRELNPSAKFTLDLSGIFGKGFCAKAETIAGCGTASISDGLIKASIPEKLDYVWIRFAP